VASFTRRSPFPVTPARALASVAGVALMALSGPAVAATQGPSALDGAASGAQGGMLSRRSSAAVPDRYETPTVR
jgi:hypothetical protein